MTYLLAKFALLFLLASLSGFVFGRWMTRRGFVDVSESYEDLRDAASRSDETKWNRLWSRLDAISEPTEIDLSDVSGRLDGLAYAIANLPEPKETQPMDLSSIDHRLDAIETNLDALDRRLMVPDISKPVPIAAARIEAATPTAADYGEKDNLRLIWGIGPRLESLLNKNGIFCFWQIADWTRQDIRQIDERLDTFKGRIDRDNWVSQAAQFSAEPGSARRLAAAQKTA